MDSRRRRLFKLSLIVFSALSLFVPTEVAVQAAPQTEGALTDALPAPAPASEPEDPATDPLEEEYDALIAETSAEEGVDPNLVRAIIAVESGFDPSAVSRKGAKGLMQLMPGTASRYAVKDPFDPVANIRGGVRYLRFLQGLFPDRLHWVLAAYNAGENAVLRFNGIPPYRETRDYVQRVLANYNRRGAEAAQPALTPEGRAESEAAPQAVAQQPEVRLLTVYRVVHADSSVTYTNVAPTQTR